jgi:hypothetical protein
MTSWRAALDRILARHEVMRGVVVETDSGPVWHIPGPDAGFALTEHGMLPAAEREQVLDAILDAPFDLRTGPLIRGCLVPEGADTYTLLLVAHHIAVDGWSLDVLLGELNALYAAFRTGAPDPLPPLPIQYADFVSWQQRHLPRLGWQEEYWRRALAGAPAVCDLPTDRPRPPAPDPAGGTVEGRLDPELTLAVRELARRQGATVYETLLASWGALVARLSGQDDVVIGTPVAGRDRDETAGLLGLFLNTLPIRLDASGGPSVAAWLTRVRTAARAAQDHADLPFERIVRLAGATRSAARTPVYQVFFSWQADAGTRLELADVTAEPLARRLHRTAKEELSLKLVEDGREIAVFLEYASAVFDEDTVRRHLDHWQVLLRAMVADADRSLDDLPLLTDHEREQLLGFAAREHTEVLDRSGRPQPVGVFGALHVGGGTAAHRTGETARWLPDGTLEQRTAALPGGADAPAPRQAAPEGPTEQRLAKLWCDLLDRQQVGRFDDFFALGGHSITATRLVRAVRQEFATEVALNDVFSHPVLAHLAARIVDLQLAAYDPDELAALLERQEL